jgi:hypothetical protein
MDKFLRFISVWTKVSIYGILGILLIILGFMLADLLFGADFGYESSDLLIVGGIAVFTIILFLVIRGMVRIAQKH